jgi:uncharacterized protein
MTETPEVPSTEAAPKLNAIIWTEIPVQDLEAGQQFYETVFGWEFRPISDRYVAALYDGEMVAGLFQSNGEADGDGVRVYVNVADLEATLKTVDDAGGAVLTPRTPIAPDMGWWAHIAANDGRLIGLCTGNEARS